MRIKELTDYILLNDDTRLQPASDRKENRLKDNSIMQGPHHQQKEV